MKEIKIKAPEGYEIDKKESTFEKIVFKKKEKILPKSWEELRRINGFYIGSDSEISEATDFYHTKNRNENIFRTIAQAKSVLAMAQLSQLMYVYNNGWEPNWVKDDTKYTISRYGNVINASWEVHDSHLLSFKTEEIRDKFLENFRPLIEQYLMIE